jgi:hypothetical protein
VGFPLTYAAVNPQAINEGESNAAIAAIAFRADSSAHRQISTYSL